MSGVLVTGLGLCTSLGEDVPANWENLTAAAAPARSAESSATAKGLARAQEMVISAAAHALADAGLWDGCRLAGIAPERIGCTISASKPLLGENEMWMPPDHIQSVIHQKFGIQGETRNVIAACATGAYAIALGASWIEQGICEAVVAGSVEPLPNPLLKAGFEQMGVVSRDSVMRPFDRRRSGFTFGEGAGVVVLESAVHARERGRRSLACLSGWGLGSDPHSAVAFNSNGQHIADVIEKALRRAGISKNDVQHVNAHGTATRLNDWIETQALHKAFGRHAGRLMISATKGRTGHLLGGAGGVEFIFTVLSLVHQYVPPTANLQEADPECSLDYTPERGHAAHLNHALSLSFGFGGPIGVLVASV